MTKYEILHDTVGTTDPSFTKGQVVEERELEPLGVARLLKAGAIRVVSEKPADR